jgi:DNA-binding transcriptional regulator GbsR (MarR family)
MATWTPTADKPSGKNSSDAPVRPTAGSCLTPLPPLNRPHVGPVPPLLIFCSFLFELGESARWLGSVPRVAHREEPIAPTSSGLSVGEHQVIGMFVQMTQALGLPRSLGEIYGLLYASPRPLAFQEIFERLGLSKGSVSQGLRFLRGIGAVQAVAAEEDRRDYFEPVLELRSLVAGFLRERLNPELESWGVRSQALAVEAFAAGDGQPLSSSDRKIIADRIGKLRTWQKRANTVLPMVSALLG